MDASKFSQFAKLYDLYHPLLTDKQKSIAEATFLQDLSLAEIAEALNITRSGVQDHLQKAMQKLEDAEASLGFLAVFDRQESVLKTLESTDLTDEQKALIQALKDVI